MTTITDLPLWRDYSTHQDKQDTPEVISLQIAKQNGVQGIYARNKAGLDGSYNQSSQLLNVFNHSLICPGSVGQPRDGAIGAQLAIYDQKNHSMQFLTLGYSMEKTIQDMEKYGFPESLVTRLKNGS